MSLPDLEISTEISTSEGSDIAEVLNLKNLAKASSSEAVISGTGMQVEQISTKRKLEPTTNLWLLVLEGELIIDLPHGDFRILRKNDSLKITEHTQAMLNPVDTVIFLQVII